MQFKNLGKIPSSFDQHASCAGTFMTIVESVGVGESFGEFLKTSFEHMHSLGGGEYVPPFFDQQASCVGTFLTIEVQEKRS